jgi:hypothetical protein
MLVCRVPGRPQSCRRWCPRRCGYSADTIPRRCGYSADRVSGYHCGHGYMSLVPPPLLFRRMPMKGRRPWHGADAGADAAICRGCCYMARMLLYGADAAIWRGCCHMARMLLYGADAAICCGCCSTRDALVLMLYKRTINKLYIRLCSMNGRAFTSRLRRRRRARRVPWPALAPWPPDGRHMAAIMVS